MKKLVAGIVSTMLALSLGMTAFAAETVTATNETKQMDVQAKAVYISPENMYTEAVSGGNAGIITQSGTQISVFANGTMLDGLTLNATEMVSSDKEAYSWISGLINGICDKFIAYDIYFTDSNGNRIEITGEVTVSITTPEGYTSVQVYHIGASEKPEEINSEQSGENTIFIAKSFSYYVLAEKAIGGSTTDTTKPESSDSPQTGDTSHMAFWLALMFVSCGSLMTIVITRKSRETNSK